MKFTERQTQLLKEIRDRGPISITQARMLRALASLRLLHRYGLLTNTTTGFALSPAGYRKVKDLA